MPPAHLLLKEAALSSLTSTVEKARRVTPPHPEYDIRLDSSRLDFLLLSKPQKTTPSPNDEGFESDVDTLSLISQEENRPEMLNHHHRHQQESDSGHGSSSSSDSETDSAIPPTPTATTLTSSSTTTLENASFNLVDCMCYTDIKSPDTLVFVIKDDALVFRFQDLDQLQQFYTAFSTFKAISNQRAYCATSGVKLPSSASSGSGSSPQAAKFNLIQRTDNDGVTHLQVTKEASLDARSRTLPKKHVERSDIISLNIPELKARNFGKQQVFVEGKHQLKNNRRSSSIENILQDLGKSAKLDAEVYQKVQFQRRVWNSAEDLLDGNTGAPRRPERRRKPKAKAPAPPPTVVPQTQQPMEKLHDVMRGQYVRVNVTSTDIKMSYPPKIVQKQPLQIKEYSANFKPIQQNVKYTVVQKQTPILIDTRHGSSSWTNSIPRFLRKPRSHSETRNAAPMAYRYIDTTSHHQQNVSNRLFGMSSKLRDFGGSRRAFDGNGAVIWGTNPPETASMTLGTRRGSLGEITYRMVGSPATSGELSSLKSVIKKEAVADAASSPRRAKSQEKKVTFSAYTTVQVV